METSGADRVPDYADALGALARVLVDAPHLRDTLEQLLEVAAVAAPDVHALTITAVTEDGGLTSAASTDDHAQAVDEFEYAIDEGPCIAALETGEEQLVADVTADDRWPRFTGRASEEGFGSVAGLPLRAPNGQVIGALNVFSARAHGLTEDDLGILRRVCAPAAAVLANARAFRRTSHLRDELAQALEDRAILNRAVGVVIGREGGDPRVALRRLEATAAREGTTVTDLAARVVVGDTVRLEPAD